MLIFPHSDAIIFQSSHAFISTDRQYLSTRHPGQSFGDQDRVVKARLLTQIIALFVTRRHWDTATYSSRGRDNIRTDQHHPEAADCEQSWWTLVPELSGWQNSPPPTTGLSPLPWRKRVRQSWPMGIVGRGTAQGRGGHLWLPSLERLAPRAGTVDRHWHPDLVNDFQPLLSMCSRLQTCSSDAVDFRGISVVRWPWLQCEYTRRHTPPCCSHYKTPCTLYPLFCLITLTHNSKKFYKKLLQETGTSFLRHIFTARQHSLLCRALY